MCIYYIIAGRYACVCLLVEGDSLHHLLAGLPAFAGGPGAHPWGRADFMCLAAAALLPSVAPPPFPAPF